MRAVSILLLPVLFGLAWSNRVKRQISPSKQLSDLTKIGCERNPTLSYCAELFPVTPKIAPPSLNQLVISACRKDPTLAFCPTTQAPPPTQPPATQPPPTQPPPTLPPVTLPPITLPPVTLPPITLPPIIESPEDPNLYFIDYGRTPGKQDCEVYLQGFRYYCFNITSHRPVLYQPLLRSCPLYNKECAVFYQSYLDNQKNPNVNEEYLYTAGGFPDYSQIYYNEGIIPELPVDYTFEDAGVVDKVPQFARNPNNAAPSVPANNLGQTAIDPDYSQLYYNEGIIPDLPVDYKFVDAGLVPKVPQFARNPKNAPPPVPASNFERRFNDDDYSQIYYN